ARARDAFYRGFVAEALATFAEREGGLLTGDDLAGWQATIEPPLEREYRGWRVSKTGPWGQGPVFLQQLALLDGFDLDDGAELVHTVLEGAKLAFADPDAWARRPA